MITALLAGIAGFFAYPVVVGIVILILSIAYTVATEADTHGFAIFLTIVAALIYAKFLIGLFVFWPYILAAVALYALIGGAYSAFRWFRYCKDYIAFHPYKNADEWETNHGKLKPEDYYASKLRPGEHKSKLIGWIAYWPWSFLWNVAGDTLTAIFEALVNVYQNIANAVIRKALSSAK